MGELQDKILKAMQSNFIGDVQFDEEEIEQMRQDCRRFNRIAQSSWSKAYRQEDICKLIVLIVNIAKSWNDESEGRFWTKLFGEIFEDSSISPTRFYNDFENCLKFYGKTLFRSKENKRMFKEVFLLHAFAPESSGESFIRLLWNWYSDVDVLNFDYQRNDAIYTKLACFLSNKFGGEADLDDDVNFEGKTYSIKSSFKYLYTQDTKLGIVLLDKVFSDIDDIYFNNRQYQNESFYAERCSSVMEKILQESNLKPERRKKSRVEHIVSDYEKIYSGYEIDEKGNANLFIPEIRAIDEEADEYKVEVLYGDQIVYSDMGYIVGNDIKRRIKRITIPFAAFAQQFLHNFNLLVKLYVIRNEEKVEIYDSKKSLFRDFMIFKSRRETRAGTCKPGTYSIVHPINLRLNEVSSCSFHSINTYTSSLCAQENDYISTDSHQVFFNQVPKDAYIVIDGKKCENVIYQKDGMEYPFYRRITSVNVIMPQDTNPKGIVITVDEEDNYPLANCSTQTDSGYCIDLSSINADGHGIHKLLISDIRQKKLLYTVVYYINKDLQVLISEKQYIFDNQSVEIKIQSWKDNRFETVNSTYARVGSEKTKFDFDNGVLCVALPYIKWRIDNNEWNYSGLNTKYWHKESFLHSNCIIEIENRSKSIVELYINETKIGCSSNGHYLLGDALIENKQNRINSVYLCVDGTKFMLFEVLNKEELDDFDIDIEEKTIDLSVGFIGDVDSRFAVCLESDENKYEFEVGLTDSIEEEIIDGEYDVTISLLDFWENKIELLRECYIIGNPDKFCFDNCKVILTKFNVPDKGKFRLQDSFLTNLKYLREESIGSVYEGVLIDKRVRFPVEVYKKDENSLKFYFIKGEDLLPVGFDCSKKSFTQKEVDGDTVVACTSCYYDTEEVY